MQTWHPISLLNVNYKLAAQAIAGRLLKVIHLVVAEDQTCGVPGRYIGENVVFLRDVVSYATMFDWQSCLWIRKKPLIEWIGLLCIPLSVE